jgi:hypothetical protein
LPLRAKGMTWKRIAAKMEVGIGTIYRVAVEGSKIRGGAFLNRHSLRVSTAANRSIGQCITIILGRWRVRR